MPLLAIAGASKSYNNVPALIDAVLDLQPGEVHALVGENGAGKSTLIKLLAGVLPADSITLAIRGEPVTIHHAQAAFDLGLRFIHQELNVVPHLSVAENIFLSQPYPKWAGMFVRWDKLNQRASDVLAQLGITHISPTRIMARLSPGDQMLVKIAGAFLGDESNSGRTNGSIYIMDEPTAALTGQEAAQLFTGINHLRQRGCAVLYVSHRLEEIFQIADRVTVMRDGRVVTTMPIVDTTPAELIRLMTGRDLSRAYPRRQSPPGARQILDAHDLCTTSVHNITFQLAEGEILGVAGLNGAGRTELLRVLMGADRLLQGEILLNGEPLKHSSPANSWQNGIAFVPEERRSQGLILSRSVSNNITLPHLNVLSHGGLFLKHRLEHATSERLGESVRLKAESTHQIVWQLSGGNQQKVVFARALARSPLVLLLDEPTRGVDVGAKYDIYALIRQIAERGTSIILVSSDLPELLGMCDRILVLRYGRLIDQIAAENVTEEHLLALCYGEIAHGNDLT